MQFVVNHTTFDPNDELDAGLLEVLEPLGIAPGNPLTRKPRRTSMARPCGLGAAGRRPGAGKISDEDWLDENLTKCSSPRSIASRSRPSSRLPGRLGSPQSEALYPPVSTEDGTPMNAMHDYELVMAAEEMPPVNAFWSATLSDNENGFFIPNDRKKYSVGENPVSTGRGWRHPHRHRRRTARGRAGRELAAHRAGGYGYRCHGAPLLARPRTLRELDRADRPEN